MPEWTDESACDEPRAFDIPFYCTELPVHALVLLVFMRALTAGRAGLKTVYACYDVAQRLAFIRSF